MHGSAKNLTVSPERCTVLDARERSKIYQEGDIRRKCRRRRPRRQGDDRQACLQARAGQPQRRLHRQGGQWTALAAQTCPAEFRKARLRLPGRGLPGGQIRAPCKIKKLTVGPANQLVQTAQNPDFVQLQEQGYPTYVASPGYSITNGIITTSGSISQVEYLRHGDQHRVKTGFPTTTAYVDGLQREPEAPSAVGDLKQQGDLINTPVSRKRRSSAANNHYDRHTGTAGPGSLIKVKLAGPEIRYRRDDRARQHRVRPVRQGRQAGRQQAQGCRQQAADQADVPEPVISPPPEGRAPVQAGPEP